ncbi:hypothetical protein H4R24_002926 [Coemansia sp. RSA 988]|nr:hypothetical protein H4R24_002926 [Coemansia sp. RSA 988]
MTSEMASVPWWAAIAGSVFVLRSFLILPVAVYQQRAAARAQLQGRVVMAWTHSMRSSLKLETQDQKLTDEQFEKILARRINLKHHDLMLRQGCHPVFSMLLPLSQLPVWLSMSYALRHLCGRPGFWDNQGAMFPVTDGMLTEGLAWFTNLTVTDPTYCLPAVLLLVNMANVMIAQRRMRNGTLLGVLQQKSGWIRAITLASYASPWIIACISLLQPTALVYYWTLSATFGLAQNIAFQNKTLRAKLKFPTLPRTTPETTAQMTK